MCAGREGSNNCRHKNKNKNGSNMLSCIEETGTAKQSLLSAQLEPNRKFVRSRTYDLLFTCPDTLPLSYTRPVKAKATKLESSDKHSPKSYDWDINMSHMMMTMMVMMMVRMMTVIVVVVVVVVVVVMEVMMMMMMSNRKIIRLLIH